VAIRSSTDIGETGRDLYRLERAVFCIDHQQVGDFIARKWRFPEELAAVIRGHHEEAGGETTLVHLVRTADAFMDNLTGEGTRQTRESARVRFW
jgi:HD-like signal output (HDOD) protein